MGRKPTKSPKPNNPDSFFEWLNKKIADLGLNDNQVSVIAGLSNSTISKARSGAQPLGFDACVALASALGIPPDIVLREAGLLPKPPNYSSDIESLKAAVADATDEEIQSYIRVIREIKAARRKPTGK